MLEILNLSKKYHHNEILGNVTLALDDNKFHFLMGKNGSGKTTLIKCLLNLESFKGTVLYGGKKINEVKETIFAAFDDTPMYSKLNGYQNLSIFVNDTIITKKLIEEYNVLSSKKLRSKVGTYSLGERKKLLILMICIKKPKYLFLDEISNGLDVETLYYLNQCLKKWVEHSLIFATGHHLEFYQDIVDNLIILHNKEISISSEFAISHGGLGEYYTNYIKSIENRTTVSTF